MSARDEVSIDEALERVRRYPTIDVPTTMALTGFGAAVVRRSVEDGTIASLRFGRNIRVLSAPLRHQLGIKGV